VKALKRSAEEVGYPENLLSAVEAVNERQKTVLFGKIKAHFGDLEGKTLAVWGLAFKPNTDDMREASSRVLMEALWAAGPKCAHTIRWRQPNAPVFTDRARTSCSARPARTRSRERTRSPSSPSGGSSESPDFDHMRLALKTPVIFDGRNLYDPVHMERAGFSYYAIGRGKRS